jgi:hypothetical protein
MDNKSRMKGDFHLRFCEKLELKRSCLLDSSMLGPFGAETPLVISLTFFCASLFPALCHADSEN